MENATTVVKKYGNRRLYDTSRSRYVNLDEIAAMVRNGIDVKVIDAVSGEDLTQVTLTQIIVEHAKQEPTSIPIELLREMIVVTDHVGREFISWYLKSAFETYEKVQSSVKNRISEAKNAATSPLELLNRFMPKESQNRSETDELLELRARVAELEKKAKKTTRKKSKAKTSGA